MRLRTGWLKTDKRGEFYDDLLERLSAGQSIEVPMDFTAFA